MRRHRENTALAQQPAALFAGESHAAEAATVDAGDAVMPRQTLVEERVIRREQFHRGAILAQDALEEHLGFALHGLAEVVVEIGELIRVRIQAANIPEVQPLSREIAYQRLRPRI